MSFEPNDYDNTYNMDYQQPQGDNGSKGMAIASMVLGIIAIVTCICYCTAIPLGIVSIVLAIIVLVKKKNGKPMAITGIVTSAIAIIVSIVIIILAMPLSDNMSDLMENSEQYIEEYKEDGTIPQSVLDMFDGNEELADQFMQGFTSSYSE